MDSDSAAMLRGSVGNLLEQTTSGPSASDLYELGWSDAIADDGPAAWSILFDEIGRRLASSPLLDAIVAETVGLTPGTVRVVLPMPGGTDIPSAAPENRLTVTGIALGGWPADPPTNVVVLRGSTAAGMFGGPAGPDAARATTISGLDPELHLVEIAIDSRQWSDVCWRDSTVAARLVAVARTALGQMLLGASYAMLDLATSYARERQQFGRPIGSFQAVKHHLADVHVAVDAAQSALEEAWATGGLDEAELAKVLAGDAGAVAARWSLQVFGAIGFTWEHVLHRYTRRVMTLDALLGSSEQIRRMLGAKLIETREVPRIGGL